MDDNIYKLLMVEPASNFRSDDGTLFIKCLFVSNSYWHEKYMKESDIFVGDFYESVYKPTKNGLYKISFIRKED